MPTQFHQSAHLPPERQDLITENQRCGDWLEWKLSFSPWHLIGQHGVLGPDVLWVGQTMAGTDHHPLDALFKKKKKKNSMQWCTIPPSLCEWNRQVIWISMDGLTFQYVCAWRSKSFFSYVGLKGKLTVSSLCSQHRQIFAVSSPPPPKYPS